MTLTTPLGTSHLWPNRGALNFFTQTQVGKFSIIELLFAKTPYVYRIVCSPPKVKAPSLTVYLTP